MFICSSFLNFSLVYSLTHWLFRSVLFCSHVFVSFPAFLLLISSFIPLRLEKIHGTISILLNFLILVLQPIIWSILGNVPCALEKNIYSAAVRWNVQNPSLSQGSQFLCNQSLEVSQPPSQGSLKMLYENTFFRFSCSLSLYGFYIQPMELERGNKSGCPLHLKSPHPAYQLFTNVSFPFYYLST